MTLIIGYGNSLRSDDGAGRIVAERLAQLDPDLAVVSTHQLLPEIAFSVAQADRVFFVDAAAGGMPGTVCCEPLHGSDAGSGHTLTPAAVLALSARVYGTQPPAWLVRLGASTFEFGSTLSTAVADAVPRAISLIQQQLR